MSALGTIPPSSTFADLPEDLLLEIFCWTSPPKNCEWYFFMIELPSVCKQFYNLLRTSQNGNFLYKHVYDHLFLWRKNPLVENRPTVDLPVNFWFDQLKLEVNFFRNCNGDSSRSEKNYYAIVQDRDISKNDIIMFKNVIGSDIIAIDRPLLLNSGCYYFEATFLDPVKSSDNIFLGLSVAYLDKSLVKDTDEQFSYRSYIGSDKCSMGYYFDNGSIYYGGTVVKSMGEAVTIHKTIGMFIDTTKLTIQFMFQDHSCDKLNLKETAPFIAEQYTTNPNVTIYPSISILYDNQRMKVRCFEVCSFEKFKWLEEMIDKD